jgi:hypothetical protein
MEAFYSIGVMDTTNPTEVQLMKDYFGKRGIGFFLEGTVMYDLYIAREQIPLAIRLLREEKPPYSGFKPNI